ncbi:hypothetical protein HY625_00025 [Candidatus Uhrbacteria bacterium]|nr:hypothetical protein [Candidatus Uhrbacteria bacterium]
MVTKDILKSLGWIGIVCSTVLASIFLGLPIYCYIYGGWEAVLLPNGPVVVLWASLLFSIIVTSLLMGFSWLIHKLAGKPLWW